MDRSLRARERVTIWTVVTAISIGVVTVFLPPGFWSTAPRGYVVGAVAALPGVLLGLAGTGPPVGREGAVDLLLSVVLAWLVGVTVVVHGEFVIVLPGDPAPATPFGLLAHRIWLAMTGWLPLGVVGFVLGTVVRVVVGRLRSSSADEES